LDEFRLLPRETILFGQDVIDIACYRLSIAIEAAFALCFHVSAKRLHEVPEEYAGRCSSLERAGFIPADLSVDCSKGAFHEYAGARVWKIDYGQVYEVISTRLDDFGRLPHRYG
jgi:uncharacterized protein YutE (UPF0331/DUF86 family)